MENRVVIHLPGDKYTKFNYPAGEAQVRLDQRTIAELSVADTVYIIARVISAEDIITLALLKDAVNEVVQPESYIRLVLPYLPYSRADRRFVRGDCFGLKTFGQLIVNMDFDKVITLDAHSPAAQHYMVYGEISTEFDDVSPRIFINKALQSMINGEELKGQAWQLQDAPFASHIGILLPDAGAARYRMLTELQCEKHRDKASGKFLGFTVPPKEKFGSFDSVLIIDDICDGGGTFIGIADLLKDYNLKLYLYVTHGIFSKGVDELKKHFHRIYTTDSFKAQFEGVERFPIDDFLLDH